ncbi:MAG: ATP-binding protein [Oscillospiraceae bacterium]|nr:ATP-binding protein [Oscillospiraceae bacterium]
MKTTARRMRQAEQALEQRRAAAERQQRQRRDIACEKIPALAALEQQLAESSAAVVSAMSPGQDSSEFLALLAKQNAAAQAERARLLQAAGLPADYLDLRWECPECHDSGFVRGRRCACFGKLLQSLAYQELSMDTPLERSAFELFRLDYYSTQPEAATGIAPRKAMEGVFQYCREYAAHFTPRAKSLFFTGPTGLGKTHLSLAIAKAALERGFPVIYGSAPNLLSRMERDRFSRFGESAGETEQALLECDLLVLDDLGAEFSTAFTQSCVYNIVNTRLMGEKPVIVSTNLNPAQLNEKYGERVTSRIIGNYMTLRFFGGDVRQKASGRG